MRPVWLVLILAACGGGDGSAEPDAGTDGTPEGDAPAPVLAITASPELVTVADPKLDGFEGWPLEFEVTSGGRTGLRCRVDVAGRSLTVDVGASGCQVIWDGRDPNGTWLPSGVLPVTAELLDPTDVVLAEADAQLEVVRLGLRAIDLAAGGVGARIPLLWAETEGELEGYYEHDGTPWRLGRDASEDPAASALELADGTPRPLPAIWEDLKTPPLDPASADGIEADTFSLPTAWVAGSAVVATATLSAARAGGASGAPQTAEVRLVPPAGFERVTEVAFADGATVAARSTASPVPAVARTDVAWRWSFEVRTAGGTWRAIPGGVTTAHRLYGLYAAPSFVDADLPSRPWVEIIDVVTRWIDGETSDPLVGAARIVDGVYYDLGLRYDDEQGASAYTWYDSDDWTEGQFELVAFQARVWGDVINCSDAASIVGTYASMVGIDLRYHILQRPDGDGFDLNYIRPIGFEEFDETPFTGGRGAFRYHAVVGPADGTFFDATLALDADGDPTAPPHAALLAHGLDPALYLDMLSSEAELVEIYVDEGVSLR